MQLVRPAAEVSEGLEALDQGFAPLPDVPTGAEAGVRLSLPGLERVHPFLEKPTHRRIALEPDGPLVGGPRLLCAARACQQRRPRRPRRQKPRRRQRLLHDRHDPKAVRQQCSPPILAIRPSHCTSQAHLLGASQARSPSPAPFQPSGIFLDRVRNLRIAQRSTRCSRRPPE